MVLGLKVRKGEKRMAFHLKNLFGDHTAKTEQPVETCQKSDQELEQKAEELEKVVSNDENIAYILDELEQARENALETGDYTEVARLEKELE